MSSNAIGASGWEDGWLVAASRRGEAQQALREHEVGLVDHLAVEREGAGMGIGGKGGDDALGPFALGGADREGFVDDRKLGRVDRHLGAEARSPSREAFGPEPRIVL